MSVRKLVNEALGIKPWQSSVRHYTPEMLSDKVNKINQSAFSEVTNYFDNDTIKTKEDLQRLLDIEKRILFEQAGKLYAGNSDYVYLNSFLRNPKEYKSSELLKEKARSKVMDDAYESEDYQKLLDDKSKLVGKQSALAQQLYIDKFGQEAYDDFVNFNFSPEQVKELDKLKDEARLHFKPLLDDLNKRIDGYINSMLPRAIDTEHKDVMGKVLLVDKMFKEKGIPFNSNAPIQSYSPNPDATPEILPDLTPLKRGLHFLSQKDRARYIKQLESGLPIEHPAFTSFTTKDDIVSGFSSEIEDEFPLYLKVDVTKSEVQPYWSENRPEAEWVYPPFTNFSAISNEIDEEGIPILVVKATSPKENLSLRDMIKRERLKY